MIDIARLYGIMLLYYGHFIEILMYLQNATAARHYKFIYSFHSLHNNFVREYNFMQIGAFANRNPIRH